MILKQSQFKENIPTNLVEFFGRKRPNERHQFAVSFVLFIHARQSKLSVSKTHPSDTRSVSPKQIVICVFFET